RLAVAGDAGADALIISVGCVLESHAVPAQHVHRTVDVLGRERDVLDPLAVILAQVFLDLALVVLRLVDRLARPDQSLWADPHPNQRVAGRQEPDRDADQPTGTGQGARDESRALALDVEVADLAEVE